MQNPKKTVLVMSTLLGDTIEKDEYTVSEFNVTYDARDVLSIRDIIDQEITFAMYGPGTWKFVGCYEEIFNDQEKEKE